MDESIVDLERTSGAISWKHTLSVYVRESFAANTQLLESYPDAIRKTECNTVVSHRRSRDS